MARKLKEAPKPSRITKSHFLQIPSEATEEDPFMSKHLDALSAWHEEADKMRDSRILPDGEDMQVNFSEQVVELLEEMVESGVLDPRTGWLSQMVSYST